MRAIDRILPTLVSTLLVASCAFAGGPGLPSRDPNLDVMPGFKNPPPGYGEVPFWWWTGDKLDVDRMIVQLKKLHEKGISGVQVNYSHYDSEGWLTDQDSPAIFSDEWWQVYSKISEACAKLDMGIGLSTYTLDWPRGAKNLFYNLFYRKPELNAIQLEAGERVRIRGGETRTITCPRTNLPCGLTSWRTNSSPAAAWTSRRSAGTEQSRGPRRKASGRFGSSVPSGRPAR